MSDRTQKVDWDELLTITARKGDIVAGVQALSYGRNPSAEAVAFRKTLATALDATGQPPVDRTQTLSAERIVARIVSHWLINRGVEIRAGQPLTGTPNGIAQEILAALPAQPPTPVLSDKEKEQLKGFADKLSFACPTFWQPEIELLRDLASGGGVDAGVPEPRGPRQQTGPASASVDPAPNLASREHRVEEGEDRYRSALQAIRGPEDSGPWITIYREAGAGYAGLQAIAEAALGEEQA